MDRSVAYLDNQATTPVDPRVREAMLPFLGQVFGNPHSRDHAFGWDAANAVRRSRADVAALVNADDDEVVFTSGATESCNLALRGVAKAAPDRRRRIITIATEHPAVIETVRDLGQTGFEVVILSVGSDGIVDLDHMDSMLNDRTLVVSVMAGNNEIGVLQPLAEIGAMCRHYGVIFHTDATQAMGRIAVDVDDWQVDLLSLSGHKMYGPKGVGALFVREGTPIAPVFAGGGQEFGLRPGTVPVQLVVGLGEACALAVDSWRADAKRIAELTNHLKAGLMESCPVIRFFGSMERRLPGSLSVGFGWPAHEVIAKVSDRIAVSTGSACSSDSTEPSRVLRALGLNDEAAASGVRISLGRFNIDKDVAAALNAFSRLPVAQEEYG
ncbi:MAG: cysteine desulfurase [Holophagales bacterium]|nr:cysteine desulfurase [Holophagales bacterium]MYG30081.1 cysteine desulfurase [Holophagales bacterium]MYI78769.1 cysteine desulfurase [Holophagales bacterium]